ncbi:phenylacetic acid degradation protein [Sulfobacillus acidophilus TPY]|uniref:Phenylacetic acid degradation protein PaaD n=1 Tax=Sulfobacillus acidophilus (strain ATCC 700253 / DSM 10332 / NAL) TaxID=679936 RepID=G8TTB4_SULAD|nr:phenylacetic acid degradation protein [Sulfobacillus acidophilus TPY]AEW04494.1 phenylacetic acid degradation protein PaaD [Sulfobacillus acidophilus DSM 10332]
MARDIFSDALGIVIDEARPGFVKAHLTLTERHQNEHQTAHGGVIFSLADAVFARASNIHGIPAVALDTSMTFVRAARAGETIVAQCEEAALRRRVAVYTVTVTTEPGELVALFRGTVYRIQPESH